MDESVMEVLSVAGGVWILVIGSMLVLGVAALGRSLFAHEDRAADKDQRGE